MIECREVVDEIKKDAGPKTPPQCQECVQLQAEFDKNPGGVAPTNKGLIFAGITGEFAGSSAPMKKKGLGDLVNFSLVRWSSFSDIHGVPTFRHAGFATGLLTLCARNQRSS